MASGSSRSASRTTDAASLRRSGRSSEATYPGPVAAITWAYPTSRRAPRRWAGLCGPTGPTWAGSRSRSWRRYRLPVTDWESAMDEIRVAIIDDHAIVRQGLRAMIDREPDLRVVGEAPSATTAMAMLDRARPGVVLLDLKLTAGSECDGLSLCKTITQRYPDSRVLVLTSSVDEWLILESIKQGAKGFVLKDVDLTELIRAIRAVHRGESAFDSRSAGVVVQWMHGSQRAGTAACDITPREREILALLARGLSNVAIGQRLYISAATVKFHVGNIMQKLGALRRAESVYAASKLGLI